MFAARCSLCNGKLNGKKICKECGLDNSKSEKYYKINNNSCDNLPLTHVHEDDWQEVKLTRKKINVAKGPAKKINQSQWTPKKDTKKGILSVLPVLCIVIFVFIGILGNLFSSDYMEPEPEYEVEALYDPYQYLGEDHPEEGDTISYELDSGQYIVGVHISPGNYRAEVERESDTVEVMDPTNSIYLYANMMSEESVYLEDLRLFEGAVVTISTQDTILLQTENGQTGNMPALMENIVTEKITMQGYDESEAGLDFEPGIYDLYTEADYSYVNLTIYEEGSEWDFRSYDLGEHGIHGSYFKNVVIPEGAVISCEEGDIVLVPSEYIWTTDYMSHYY